MDSARVKTYLSVLAARYVKTHCRYRGWYLPEWCSKSFELGIIWPVQV